MRIIFFSHYFPPEGNAPASRIYQNCRRWVRQGHDVTVVTCAPNSPDGVVYDGYKNRLFSREEIDRIAVVRVWTYIAANKGTVRRIANYVSYMVSAAFFSLFLRKPDVVIATSPQFFCGWAGAIYGLLRHVPFILEVRDIWPESIVTVGAMRQGRLLRILEWLELKLYALARHIVTVGDGYRGRLLERGVADDRISIVTNGLDLEMFTSREPDPELIERWNLSGKFVCSYVGTIGMACGLDVTLRAGRILKEKGRDDVVFLLVGSGAVREDLEKQVREQGLDNIILTGRLDKSLMPGVLSITNACLIHLKKSNLFATVMPSKIFEAAGMRRAIILGIEGAAADLVKRANAGICIEPDNEEELVAAVERLSADTELCSSYGQAGHEYTVKNFNCDDLAQDYVKVIEQVIKGKRDP